MMRVPTSAAQDVQQAFRDVFQAIERLQSAPAAANLDLAGRRVVNAGDGQREGDYVTLRQLLAKLATAGSTTVVNVGGNAVATDPGGSAGASDTVDTLTVRQILRVLGQVLLPGFTDGTAHHAILFVNSDGQLAINEDGAAALDLNIAGLKLEIGYGLTIYWFNQAGLASPAVDVVTIVDSALAEMFRFDKSGALLKASVPLADGAAAAAGTLTNAPATGDPTKWLAVNDNGTVRWIPAW